MTDKQYRWIMAGLIIALIGSLVNLAVTIANMLK